MKARRRDILWLLVLAFAVPAVAETPSGGTESNLGLGASSRGIALGGAFLARVDDASAVYWNPAGLASLVRGDISIMHAPMGFAAASQTFVGLAYPTVGAGSFGLGFMRLGSGGIQAYDADSRPQGEIDYAESSFYLSYAARPRLPGIGRALSLGATARTLTQSLTPWSSTSAGLDLGLEFSSARWNDLGVALVLQDAIAPRPRLDQEVDPIPSTLRLAGSCRLVLHPTLAFDVHLGVDRVRALGWSPRVGIECAYRGRLRLRLGGSRYGVAFGVGLAWQQFALDYAYLTQSEAGTQPVSLGAEWGRSISQRLEARVAARAQELQAHLQSLLDARLASAQAAYDRGDYAAALDEWKVVAGLDPAEERAQSGLQAASARLAAEQSRTLADQGQAAARAAQFELGLRYYGASDYVLACNVWRELLASDPKDAEAARYLDKSAEALRAQVRQQAEQARQYEARRDWVSALATWTRVRLADPQHPEATPGLARCRGALERPGTPRTERAPETPAATVRRAPGETQYSDALTLYAAGDVARAVTLLREVRKLDPGNQAAEQLLAKAERQLQPLGAEDRARVRDLYLRGMGYFTANEFERAIDEWSKILVLDPGNTSVYQNIQDARARLGALRK